MAVVTVRVYGEAAHDEPIAGCLRVLVDGTHVAGVVFHQDYGTWQALYSLGRPGSHKSGSTSGHETAQEAIRVALRRGLARKLGARASSPVVWTDRARKLAARGRVDVPAELGRADDSCGMVSGPGPAIGGAA